MLRRGPWGPREDERLVALIQYKGAHHWVEIARELGSRSAKQCRERWHNHLDPTLLRTTISAEEGRLIQELVDRIGTHWAEIARRLPGRSDNTIKNWYNGSVNRRKRSTGDRSSATSLKSSDDQSLSTDEPQTPPMSSTISTLNIPIPPQASPHSMFVPLPSPSVRMEQRMSPAMRPPPPSLASLLLACEKKDTEVRISVSSLLS